MRTLTTIALALGLASPAAADLKFFPERQETCVACHGENGVSEIPEVPSLAGQPDYYALLQLVEFREGNRDSPEMAATVDGMTNDDLKAAAAFVGSLPPAPAPGPGDPAQMKAGSALSAQHGCARCHGAEYRGGQQIPALRNQRADYIVKALQDYRAERRIGERAAMVEVAAELSDAEMADLAHYFAHQP
ncbi:c-type cytochrome [Acuticoccus sp. I52.16.1]|uniref:c-type cytochrome n=1 Tax=Acuticoccus sp. I52.16.1 TaxID=2928472 RepID=UPI001FD1DDA3|nr:c-type cytochrome [Acuticoccus sp. I52.16.1]UOM36288.1 c-type cytochrome [Acuticoccus sp. I52.16.1]